MTNLKQFKLTNNDEIVCEVVDIGDEEEGGIVIRRALRILASEDYDNNVRYYSFKPLVSFQDQCDELIVMNVGHIICETLPSRTLAIHYARAIKEVERSEGLKKDLDLEEWLDEIDGLDEEELSEWVQKKLREIEAENHQEDETPYDSDSPNIIQFNPKGTLH